MNDLPKIISDIYQKEYGVEWSGYIYRAGHPGIFYHTDPEGARFYGSPKAFHCPDKAKTIVIDDSNLYDLLDKHNIDEDDWVVGLQDTIIPSLLADGFEAVVVNMETGLDVEGIPVEVALSFNPKLAVEPEALATLL